MNVEKMSDSELYSLCKKYGNNAKLWMRKFAGLLPEVYRRRLYRRRGFASIHEFAAKLAGMSEASVDRILCLSRKLEDKPVLKKQLEEGEQSWSKIKTVAYVATPETDEKWAQKVEILPQLVLEACVQNYRSKSVLKDISEPNKKTSQTRERFSFEVNEKTALKFRQFKQEIESKRGETLSFGEVLESLLTEKQPTKKPTIKVCPDCAQKKGQAKKSGAIPRDVQRLVRARQNHKCNNCNNPIEQLHHTKRFSIEPDHDPDFIVGLCKNCHTLVHSSLVPNERESNWQILESPDYKSLKWQIDQKVMNARSP
jgi:hypothetical protein